MINNINYIANLMALGLWYKHVRRQFVSDDFPQLMLNGLEENLNSGIGERLSRLTAFGEKMLKSAEIFKKVENEKSSATVLQLEKEVYDKRSDLIEMIQSMHKKDHAQRLRDGFLEKIHYAIDAHGKNYLKVIKTLSSSDAENGTRWLQTNVDQIRRNALMLYPSFYFKPNDNII
jgi:UDP-N-acetylglucosamine/UDP-N-acetylgalactosamine diphosphorylase